jgi:ABC-2 type transport system permease protein
VAVEAPLAVAGCLVVGRLLLPAHDVLLRPAVGSVLLPAARRLLSLGTATAIRDPAAGAAWAA